MEKKYYIYAHINPVKNEIFYIGKGTGRRSNDLKRRTKFWKSVRNKYGLVIDILEEGLTEKEAFEKETWYINRIGRRDLGKGPLVNMTNGGDGQSGLVVSKETREKISIANKGKVAWNKGISPTDATLKKLSDSHKGFKPTDETRKKLSESRKNRIFSEETREKISNSNKGKKRPKSQEHLEKIIKANTGKKRSEESKKRMSIAQKGNNKKYFTEEDRLNAIRENKLKYYNKEKIKN